MKRVSIIGCPGAGKTTFSRELSHSTGLPLIHLDRIYHDEAYSYQNDKDSWRSRVLSEVKKKQWIIDGNYKSTFDIRLPKSDTIIFLDYPTYLSVWRAIKRRMYFHKRVREDMPPTWKERLGWNFFMFILKFNRSIAPHMRQSLKSYTDENIVILRSSQQAKKYLVECELSSKI